MIEFTTGDMLEAHAEALVNAVNCVGIMGRGLALQFKEAFPDNFRSYVAACGRGEVQPGRMFVFETGRPISPKYIVNFPTKRHWKSNSRLEDVEAGLVALRGEIEQRRIRSIAVPALGAGLGGLPWKAVRSRIEAALAGLSETRVTVFEALG
jgi:O-acetyl-ADP-ribose deacetylase (regulator of RNase III)